MCCSPTVSFGVCDCKASHMSHLTRRGVTQLAGVGYSLQVFGHGRCDLHMSTVMTFIDGADMMLAIDVQGTRGCSTNAPDTGVCSGGRAHQWTVGILNFKAQTTER